MTHSKIDRVNTLIRDLQKIYFQQEKVKATPAIFASLTQLEEQHKVAMAELYELIGGDNEAIAVVKEAYQKVTFN